MSRYFDAMTAALRRHGGTIEKFIARPWRSSVAVIDEQTTRSWAARARERKPPSRR